MAINVSVQYDGGFLPDISIVDPMLLPSGNPFNCHEEVLYFQPPRAVLMGTKSCTKILILPKIFPTRFRFTFYG